MRFHETVLERLRNLPLRAKLWWGAGALLLLTTLATSTDSCFGLLVTFGFVLWAMPTLVWAFLWFWNKITYRIGVRLLISYLLIGVLPFPLILGLLGFAGYVLIGQYASSEFGDMFSRVEEGLEEMARDTAEAPGPGDAAALQRLHDGPDWDDSIPLTAHVRWLYAHVDKDPMRSHADFDISIPRWVDENTEAPLGPFRGDGDQVLLATVFRRLDRYAVVGIRLTPEVGEQLSEGQWYTVHFSGEGSSESWEGDKGFWRGLWNNRWITFTHPGPETRMWDDGEITDSNSTIWINTSPRETAAHLFRAPSDFRKFLQIFFLATCFFFLTVYLLAVGLAIYYILVITRATARLTTGARQVQAGHLDHRIPVKRRDQLGDLAVAFNQMTESVASMLGEVAEKERLKNELELAREIQQSLLPQREELRHGDILVHAYFRPAAEVGGDYFDLFPLERGHLIVAVGDVAGHGLPTGLLMAMIKSAVATLIQEGHRGAVILERLNQFMLKQPREHRMVTLAIAEIDVAAGVAEITNAAHPPMFLLGETVREVLLPALPVGYKWPKPPPTERLELTAGSRLVFYSDGFVEAADKNDEQFGYERLKALLEEHAELGSEALLARMLEDLELHTGGRPLDDDLTLLVIDCGVGNPP